MTYVQAGAGIGVVAEGVTTLQASQQLVFRPLHPLQHVELVLVWDDSRTNPAVEAFRRVSVEWLAEHKPF